MYPQGSKGVNKKNLQKAAYELMEKRMRFRLYAHICNTLKKYT